MSEAEDAVIEMIIATDALPGYLQHSQMQQFECMAHRAKKKCCKSFKKGKRCGKCPKR